MIPYIINVALVLAGCLAFYKVLLRRETFYRMNRYILIGCLFISFTLPLAKVPQRWAVRKQAAVVSQQTVPQESITLNQVKLPATTKTVKPIVETPVIQSAPVTPSNSRLALNDVLRWLGYLYWFGVIVFGMNFLFQFALLLFKSYRNPVIIDGKYRIAEVSGDAAPCSFGNTIFINPAKYDWTVYEQIIQHEKVHVRQRHTLDLLMAEIVLIFQWFNPFAWFYRHAIENNLEFLADEQLVEQDHVEKESYQMSLLKVSAPHLPLSLTTNYNQSILKTRIAMMNAKKSNFNTAWKYLFLLPLVVALACLLNEPKAISQTGAQAKTEKKKSKELGTEGSWFATIKGEKVSMQFKDDDDDGQSFNSSEFKVSDFSALPQGTAGTFKMTREAGTMEFTGKFEGTTGMGHYKFVKDAAFESTMNGMLKDKLEDNDVMVFFFLDIRKGYVQMLKGQGYTDLDKDQVIPLVALKVDEAFITSMKTTGFKDLSTENLVTLKALDINSKYISEIREAGLKDISLDQIVAFKAQGIDKEYIEKVRTIKSKEAKDGEDKNDDAEDIISFKAMSITPEYVNSFRAVGYTDISKDELVSMKSLDVTPEYIKGWQALGYKNLKPDELVALKSLGITSDFLKGWQAMGYKDLGVDELTSLKSLGITSDFVKSFEAVGYKNIKIDQLTALKSLDITPDFIKGFEKIGYKNIPIDDLAGLKSTGVTPAYVTSMKEKGFNYDKLEKYITLKSID